MVKANTLAAGRLCALLAAAALALPLSASADEQSGMVVVRDAQTKQLRMATPQEMRALRASPQSDTASRQALSTGVTARADGTLQKRLGASRQVYSVMTRDADGKLGMQCVDGEHAAHAALARPTPAAAHNKEHSHETR